MSMWRNVAGTWRKGVIWRNVNGTWRKGIMWQNVAGTWRKDTKSGGSGGALVVTADPTSVFGAVSRAGSVRVYTNSTTITPTGGSGTYSYAWSGTTGWTIANPSGPQTQFSTLVSPGGTKLATFSCVVTDTSGQTTAVTVQAEADNYYSGGNNAQIQ